MKITKQQIREIVQQQFDRLVHEQQEELPGGANINALRNILTKKGLANNQKEVAEAIIQAALIKVAPLEKLINMAVNAVRVKPDEKTKEAAALAIANTLKNKARQKRKNTIAAQ